MHLDVAAVSTAALAVVAVTGAAIGLVAWFYRRGQQEQSLASSVKGLTETGERQADATKELAGAIGGLRETIQSHAVQLADHAARLRAGGL